GGNRSSPKYPLQADLVRGIDWWAPLPDTARAKDRKWRRSRTQRNRRAAAARSVARAPPQRTWRVAPGWQVRAARRYSRQGHRFLPVRPQRAGPIDAPRAVNTATEDCKQVVQSLRRLRERSVGEGAQSRLR